MWAEFAHTRDPDIRNRLVLHYQFLVDRIARKQATRLPVPVEDLMSDGMLGLLDAVDKFDPSRGVQFEAYASTRIRGAIIDGLRSMDWVPRSVRSMSQQITQAAEMLTRSLNRQPTVVEIAGFLGCSVQDVSKNWSEGQIGFMLPQSDYVPDLQGSVEYSKEIDLLREVIASRLAEFDEREHWLFMLYYYEGLTLAEIGVVLGVTEARVCQIQTKAMDELCVGVMPR